MYYLLELSLSVVNYTARIIDFSRVEPVPISQIVTGVATDRDRMFYT